MKNIIAALFRSLIVISTFILVSCGGPENEPLIPSEKEEDPDSKNEWMTYEPITFDFIGINVANIDMFTMEGIIAHTGETFTLVPSEKDKVEAYVTQIIHPYGKPIVGYNPFETSTDIILSDTWGKISYTNSPYSINITINKNDTGIKRIFMIRIGGVSKYTYLRLLQDSGTL